MSQAGAVGRGGAAARARAAARPPALGRRALTKTQNRAAIIGAAREVFAELGYDAAGVRDVIRRTGLASGTFYNYFPDKESVFRATLEESVQDVRGRLLAIRAKARTVEQFVGDAYRAWFEFLVQDRVMFELVQRNAATIRAMVGDPILGAGVQELLDDLRAAIERGDLPPLDADYLTGAMVGAAFELAIRMTERNPADVDGAARFATELFLGGIERLGRATNAPAPSGARIRTPVR